MSKNAGPMKKQAIKVHSIISYSSQNFMPVKISMNEVTRNLADLKIKYG